MTAMKFSLSAALCLVAIGLNCLAASAAPPAPQLTLQIGHSFDCTCVAFAPDNRFFASVASQQSGVASEVKIWDAANTGLWRTLSGPCGDITQVAFAGTSRFLVSSGTAGVVRLWNTQTGEVVCSFPKLDLAISNLAVSPDGRWLAAGTIARGFKSLDDPNFDSPSNSPKELISEVRLWDLKTRLPAPGVTWPGVRSLTAEFDSSGQRLIVTAPEEIGILNLSTRQWERKISAPHADLGPAVLSPDGKWLAAGNTGCLRVWSMTGKIPPKVWATASSGGPCQVAFMPDSKTLVAPTSSPNSSCGFSLWDVPHGRSLPLAGGDGISPDFMALSPDGRLVVGGGEIGYLIMRDAHTGKILMEPPGRIPYADQMVFSPDGSQLVSGNEDGTLRFWNLRTGRLDRTVNENIGDIMDITFSTNGRQISSLGSDKKLQAWTIDKAGLRSILNRDVPNEERLAISQDNSLVATLGGKERSVRIWASPSGKLVQYITGHGEAVTGAFFTGDKKTLISSSLDGTIKFWDVAVGVCRRTLTAGAPVTRLANSAGGVYLAAGDEKGGLHVWKAATREPLRTFSGHQTAITALEFTPEGTLLSASVDGRVSRWNVSSGQCLSSQAFSAGFAGAFSPDGHFFAFQDEQRLGHLADLHTGKTFLTFAIVPSQPGEDESRDSASPNWITFTPGGHYESNPAAEKFLRWRAGTNLKPAQAFAPQFRRPDQIAKALASHH